MANYTPTFIKPYPNGWVDKPSKTTPATAAIMNSYDTAIAALEAYLRDNAIDTVSVSVEQFPSDGRQWLGTITVGSNQYKIYMPSLQYENSVSDGVKIGVITLGEQSFDVYAPTSSTGGSTVSVVPKTLTGTNIAEITVDGTTYQLYAPTGGSGSTVTAEATLTEGTEIGKVTIDGKEIILYAPTASAITVDSELSATSENPVQNKVVKAELDQVNSNLSNLKVSDVAGGKNLIVPTIQSVLEKNGIVVTDNNDGTYTVNGTNAATGNTTFDVYVEIKSQGSTSAKLLGCPPNDKGLILQTYYDGSWGNSSTWDRGNGSTIDDLTKLRRLSILIPGGKTVDNVVFKPMITTDMDATYNDYEPYIPSVKMLASDLSDVKDGTTPVAKAVADEDGNNIKSTYVKKTEVPSGSIVDSELSETSTNPVQNKVVTTELNKKLETLDDESQVPDAVNFDLDSELSLTSVKGVQNKAIAEEFQKYENGTKKVAKATEAETAKTAESATTAETAKTAESATKATQDAQGNVIDETYAKKTEIPSTPSSLYETVDVSIITDLFAKSIKQHYVNCERVGNICTLSFWLQATASVDYKNRHELFYIDKIPKNNLTIGFCVVNFNHSVSNTANSAYNYINSISVEEYYNAALRRNASKVYLLPYRIGSNILSSGYDIIGQVSWAVEVQESEV